MARARVNGIDLYYESHGDGAAVVFAHGRGGNHLSWWQQVASFAPDYRCITFDHRGFGLSQDVPGGPGSAAFAGDLLGLLDHLEIRDAHLVGQSMGGLTCLDFALAHRERTRGLVLAGTTGGIADPGVLAALKRRGPLPADLTERALSDAFRQKEPTRTFLFREISSLNPEEQDGGGALFTSGAGPKAPDLARFRIPTLFIVGSADVITPVHVVEATAKCIPNSKLEVVDGAGHSVYYEMPDRFNDLILDFLSSVEAQTRLSRN